MAIQFPSNPNNGQLFEVGSEVYSWNSAKSRWVSAGYSITITSSTAVTAAAVSSGPTTSAGFFQLPQGTTAQRPSIVTTFTTATGGAFSTTTTGLFSGTSAVHVFTAPGYFTATSNIQTTAFLAVGGGGAGGGGRGGGGGGGGVVTGTFVALAGTTYTVTVGPGGPGPTAAAGSTSSITASGLTIRALGGGHGGVLCGGTGTGGGSGGGGNGANPSSSIPGGPATQPAVIQVGVTTATNRGFPGGPGGGSSCGGGGGGGAGSVGGSGGGGGSGGSGGSGYTYTIIGSPATYGAGGTGYNSGNASGGANTGKGGGADCGAGAGSGGPGIVVLSYALTTSTSTIPPAGSTRFNTSLNQIEISNGSAWIKLIGTAAYNVDLLVVGGGGSSFSNNGGGAGGYLAVNIPVTTGTAYTVTVGAGGGTPGSVTGVSSSLANSATGVVVYTALGGQGGQPTAGGNSGATQSPANVLSYGFTGNPLGGGAGSREPGHGAQGGSGTAWYDGQVYAAGGSTSGSAGSPNTGNGGNGAGSAGASGLVKIRYPGTQQIGSGGTTSTAGGYFFHTFTTSGTYTG